MEKYDAAETGEILVTPEILLQSSQILGQLCTKLAAAYDRLQELMESTQTCFAGKSAERFRRRIRNRRQEGVELAQKLLELTERLAVIAQEYSKAEKENRNVFDGN